MTKGNSQPSTCNFGKGKSYDQSCNSDECKVIHFPWGKRNQYKTLLDVALNDLVSYVKAYFYNYKDAALAKFTSFATTDELDEQFYALFWHWYVLNYRCYKDVSPVVDFYLTENMDKLDDKFIDVLEALKNSYLSLYIVKWINNNTVALQDTILGYEYVVERNFGEVTRLIEEGSLLLARLVVAGSSALVAGKVIIVQSDQLSYLQEEIESIRTNHKVSDKFVFIKEFGEVLCGLVLDLTHGIKKNRLKARTLKKIKKKVISKLLITSNEFEVIEQNKFWLKLVHINSKGSFNRIYVLKKSLTVVSENLADIKKIINLIEEAIKEDLFGIWEDGFCFETEEEAEEVLLEIMHDRYLDDWLNSPHIELENMTPLQAVEDVKGRVLLDNLLNDLEIMELRAKSKNEYYIPTSVIKSRLKLDRNKFSKELLHPEAIAIKVQKYRLKQEVSPFITAYNWSNEEYRHVAIAAFDLLYADAKERNKLAWMLFMWNEYSNIYRPTVSRDIAVLAALEHTYLELTSQSVSYAYSSKKYGIPSGIINKNVHLLLNHFKKYPLDFSVADAQYPEWEELTYNEKIRAYDEVWQHLYLFTYAIKKNGEENEESRTQFYEVMNSDHRFWTDQMRKIFDEFYKYYYMLDYLKQDKSTFANIFWEHQAKRFPPYLKTAAFNIMMSYVGAYRVHPKGANDLIFEDYFTGESYSVYGNFGSKVHENIIPGMVCITRMLPVGDKYWIFDPMYIVLPDLLDLFKNNIDVLLEEFNPYDISDIRYLKKRGEILVKAYILAMGEMEQNAISIINQPLQINWYVAGIINYQKVVDLLNQSKKIKMINKGKDYTTFLWMSFNSSQQYQWGYIFVSQERILITAPPGKDLQKFMKHIRKALKNEDIVVAFRLWEASLSKLKMMEKLLVSDLAFFFNDNPELSLALLRQDDLNDEELEWQQGIFLLKLGSMLMDYLDETKR